MKSILKKIINLPNDKFDWINQGDQLSQIPQIKHNIQINDLFNQIKKYNHISHIFKLN